MVFFQWKSVNNMSSNSFEKWPGTKMAYTSWWESLDLEGKRQAKLHYEKVRQWNSTRKNHTYPDMYDTTVVRISQLSNKQICRIWVFKDHPSDRVR